MRYEARRSVFRALRSAYSLFLLSFIAFLPVSVYHIHMIKNVSAYSVKMRRGAMLNPRARRGSFFENAKRHIAHVRGGKNLSKTIDKIVYGA